MKCLFHAVISDLFQKIFIFISLPLYFQQKELLLFLYSFIKLRCYNTFLKQNPLCFKQKLAQLKFEQNQVLTCNLKIEFNTQKNKTNYGGMHAKTAF